MLNRNLAILIACGALAYCLMAIVFMACSVAGYHLAPSRSLVLLPLVMEVFGACLFTVPAAYLMRRFGRRSAFLIGSSVGAFGGCLCAYAIYDGNFWMLVASTPLLGALSGFGEYTRYAAAELFHDETQKGKAVSYVVSGGIVAAFIGPSLSTWSNDQFETQFLGPFVICTLLCVLSFCFYACLTSNRVERQTGKSATRFRTVMSSPVFIAGTMAGVVAFLSMAVIMDALPMTMLDHGFHYEDATHVIQWHLLAMFAPSWITGKLIERYGTVSIITLGIGINAIGVVFGLWGVEYVNFFAALFLVGLGWNLMFVAGTTLVATIQEDRRAAAEGASNFLMSSSFALATPIAAFLAVSLGWIAVCLFAAVMLVCALVTVTWFALKEGHRLAPEV